MTEEFRIERYRRSDRERVFDLMRVALPVPAPMLIRNWQWMFDANPFNGDAERNRTTNREGLLAFLRETTPLSGCRRLFEDGDLVMRKRWSKMHHTSSC